MFVNHFGKGSKVGDIMDIFAVRGCSGAAVFEAVDWIAVSLRDGNHQDVNATNISFLQARQLTCLSKAVANEVLFDHLGWNRDTFEREKL